MTSFVTSDPTLQVGDLVFSTYHKGEYLFKITEITRRFYNAVDLAMYNGYKIPHQVGDEYNPIVKIESVNNLSIVRSIKNKYRKTTKTLDAKYLIRVEHKYILEHINKLQNLLNEL